VPDKRHSAKTSLPTKSLPSALCRVLHSAKLLPSVIGILSECPVVYVEHGVVVLQYADDTILCLKDEAVARNTKLLLYLF
jgi:hypothetical protein